MKEFNDYQTFEASVKVHRLEDTGTFVAEIAIRCRETGEIMEMADEQLPIGVSTSRLSVDPMRWELRFPLRPPTVEIPGHTSWKSWDHAWNELNE